MRGCIKGHGHMARMTAMAINSKRIFFFFRSGRPMILKLGMKHQGMELYKVYISHEPETNMTFIVKQVYWYMSQFTGPYVLWFNFYILMRCACISTLNVIRHHRAYIEIAYDDV